jgi:hypothetical protein
MRKLIITSLLLFIAGKLDAQTPQSFSPEPGVFIKEFESFIRGAAISTLEPELNQFLTDWNTGRYDAVQQKSIQKLCNNMLMRKLAIQPYFELVITSMNAYTRRKLPAKNLQQWQQITEQLLGKNPADYLAFLKVANNLFRDNTLYQDLTKKWYCRATAFDISYRKDIEVRINKTDLVCRSAFDSFVITGTSGTFLPAKNLWLGNAGFTDWERTLPGEKVKVQLYRYNADVSTAEYKADSAWIYYGKYFNTQVLGHYEDKASYASNEGDIRSSSYPKFSTFRNDLEIRNLLGPSATYKGGLSISGSNISTANRSGEESVITILYKGKPRVIATSPSFKVIDGAAQSLEASFKLLMDSGRTIFHPKIQFNFNFRDGRLLITKGETGLMRAPFADDYHKVDIDVQQIRWKIDEPLIDFDNVNKNQEVKIESASFFKEYRYEKFQGMLRYNPLEKMTEFYRAKLFKQKRTKFALTEYAGFLNNTKDRIEAQLIDLSDGGFIVYNPFDDSITLRPKLFNYVQNHYKLKDYDVIRFSSLISARPNATLNILSNELKVEGVQRFYFSDSQNVIVAPTEQTITILNDRRIKFAGQIRAGRFDFYGRNFEFDYGNFQIKYSNIDSMRIYYPDSTGKAIVPIKSVLRNIYGTLYIDKPNNKSGLKDYPEYPIFRSDKGSVITYDKPHIHGGVYEADKFHFEVDPFTIDSLDNFTIAGLAFDGTFRSDDIFPEFREQARIQKDYSLGFITRTPPGGYPMYRGKGRGDMTISLSEEGLYGSGEITYQGSTTKSRRFLMLPDRMRAPVDSYELPENDKYPEVYAAGATAEWKPYSEEFKIANGESPIRMFKMGHRFYGNITQTPTVLKGDGTLKWSEAEYASRKMRFGPMRAESPEAALKIYSLDSTRVAFRTDNVRGGIDFDKGEGNFTNNITGSPTYFPWNQYATNMADYKWDMNRKLIEVLPGASLGGEPGMFVSTLATQDSLRYEAQKGIYDLQLELLKVEGIPYIDIADSRMFLKDGKVTIRKAADMDPVDSARIVANRNDKFHEVYRMRAKIFGRNKMRGDGFYVYVNKNGQKQEITMDSVLVNRFRNVEAWGKIDESQNFTLDTKIGYKGLVLAKSNEKLVQFTGYVKPLHTFENILPSAWLRCAEPIDPKDVVINLTDPRDKDKKRQFVGLYIANDSSHVYPLFYSWKRRYSDIEITGDTGILYYDQDKQSFFAGSRDKLLNGGLKGNFIQLNESTKAIHAEGRMDFGFDNGAIRCVSAGTADLVPGDSSFSFRLAIFIDFLLPKTFNDRLYAMLTTEDAGTGDATLNDPFVEAAVGELIRDDKDARAVMKAIETTGKMEPRGEAGWKFCFTEADFRWDSRRRGMANTSEVAMANFDGRPVNRTFNTTMLVEHRRSGENLFMYIEIAKGSWVYLNAQRNVVYVWSSDEVLNQAIINEGQSLGTDMRKRKKARKKENLNTDTYMVRTAAPSMVDRFLRRFE